MNSVLPRLNALVDIRFLKTNQGRMSVRSFLLRAHEPDLKLSTGVPGYVLSAQLRLLTSILAVVLRFEEGFSRRSALKLIRRGLSETAVDAAINELAMGSYLHDPQFPFMQRPALNVENPKDSATYVGKGEQPVKKLSPSMPPDEAEDFWDLSVSEPKELEIEDAVLNLVVFHFMSVAGNNKYAGAKCEFGSPAIRWVGKDLTATEILWLDETSLGTLMCAIPLAWVEGEGLPAWADRTAKKSLKDNQHHPLWAATWSSNTAATAWDDGKLVGVRTGGVPDEWYPFGGAGKNSAKDWWNIRNQQDPFYLYIDVEGEKKLQRLDLGKDVTALATDWAAENKTEKYRQQSSLRMHLPGEDARLIFLRHRIEGTATSSNIRASEIFIPERDQWALDSDTEVQYRIISAAKTLKNLQRRVVAPFRRENSNERSGGKVPLVLDFLADARNSVIDAYWRHTSDTFSLLLKEIRETDQEQFVPSEALCNSMFRGLEAAFDEVTQPYFGQEPARISQVRAGVLRQARAEINRFRMLDEVADEE